MTVTDTRRATFNNTEPEQRPPGNGGGVTAGRVGQILWRRRVVCAVFAAIVMVVGGAVVLSQPKTYQSTASVALLPQSTNPGILPNYPNLIISLIPTYVQLVSSPVLLDQVAADLPFHTTGAELANNVHAESLSNAAVINIVAESQSPAQAQDIATATTMTFIRQLQGNGVVIPRIYAMPATAPAPPRRSLLLGLVAILALLFGLAAGLVWDRLAKPGDGTSVDRTRERLNELADRLGIRLFRAH